MMYEEIRPMVQALWEVWLFVLFVGIVAWALWPSRQKEMNEHANIPLRDEENGHVG
ncbi:MAG: cbb3-type cytochrome c oxidase subunit 3 [Geminicoccaceae bacterium]|nr:cbb3-type cytochrome c oxidase subunit 3 [Geminicoccaceae bacterium]